MTNPSAFIAAFYNLSYDAHKHAREKGFWETSDKLQALADANGLGAELALMRKSQLRDLMASELGEACEGDRKNLTSDKIPGFTNAEEEYADLIIRLADMAEGMRLRIGEAVVAKMEYNATRPHLHGGKSF